MANQTTPSNWKVCATCSYWGGSRRPADPFRKNVEYESNQKGRCSGGGFNQIEMSPLATCNKWEPQYR